MGKEKKCVTACRSRLIWPKVVLWPPTTENILQVGKTILVWGAGPHGSSRVPTGFHGRFFQAVFRLGNYRFSAFFGAFSRGKSIGAAGRLRILLFTISIFQLSEVGLPPPSLDAQLRRVVSRRSKSKLWKLDLGKQMLEVRIQLPEV